MRDPDTSRSCFHFLNAEAFTLPELFSDYGIRRLDGQEEDKETPGILGISYAGLCWAVRTAYEIESRFLFRFSFCYR